MQSNDDLVTWVSGKTQELEDRVQLLHLLQFRTYVSSCFGCGQLLFPQDHEECKQGHQEAVASITKHHSKEKWKRNYGIGRYSRREQETIMCTAAFRNFFKGVKVKFQDIRGLQNQ